MQSKPLSLANMTSEERQRCKELVETWQRAGVELERIRNQELREMDTYKTIQILCFHADYTVEPRAPKPTSGLIEQQRIFKKAHPHA